MVRYSPKKCRSPSLHPWNKNTLTTPKQASRDKANGILTKREAQLPYLGEQSDNALAAGFNRKSHGKIIKLRILIEELVVV